MQMHIERTENEDMSRPIIARGKVLVAINARVTRQSICKWRKQPNGEGKMRQHKTHTNIVKSLHGRCGCMCKCVCGMLGPTRGRIMAEGEKGGGWSTYQQVWSKTQASQKNLETEKKDRTIYKTIMTEKACRFREKEEWSRVVVCEWCYMECFA